MAEFRVKNQVNHLFSADIDLKNWGSYPEASSGVRVNATPVGGIVFDKSGEIGTVIPGGEVNEILRYNGVFDLEGRLTFRLNDGRLVYLPYDGRADFCRPEECVQFAEGKIDRSLSTSMAVYMESTDRHLDKAMAIAVGKVNSARKPEKLSIDVYEIICLPM